MGQFDPIAVPQGRTEVLLALTITASVGATAQIGAPRRKSINFAGSAGFCRPRS